MSQDVGAEGEGSTPSSPILPGAEGTGPGQRGLQATLRLSLAPNLSRRIQVSDSQRNTTGPQVEWKRPQAGSLSAKTPMGSKRPPDQHPLWDAIVRKKVIRCFLRKAQPIQARA
jgi:hypothetical protein